MKSGDFSVLAALLAPFGGVGLGAFMNNSMNTSAASVVVAVCERFNESYGPYEIAYHWDGVTVTTTTQRGNDESLCVNATEEQIMAAGDWYQIHSGDNKKGTYIGCIVMLKGSRKAPNAKPLLVVDYADSYYDDRYMQRIPAKAAVLVDGREVWVSANCIDKLVSSARPYWACRD